MPSPQKPGPLGQNKPWSAPRTARRANLDASNPSPSADSPPRSGKCQQDHLRNRDYHRSGDCRHRHCRRARHRVLAWPPKDSTNADPTSTATA
jgi:hypothetical protein